MQSKKPQKERPLIVKTHTKKIDNHTVRYAIDSASGKHMLFVRDLVKIYGRGFLNRVGLGIVNGKVDDRTVRLIIGIKFMALLQNGIITAAAKPAKKKAAAVAKKKSKISSKGKAQKREVSWTSLQRSW